MRILHSSRGFTFIGALMIVVIMGIMLGITGTTWRMTMQRERETELLFRGLEYQRAIQKWHNYTSMAPGAAAASRPIKPLNDMKDLLSDPSSLERKRYLRRLYLDPITGKEFTEIRDKQKGRGIIGVASTSEEKPVKTGGFEKQLKHLENKDVYNKWVFGILDAVSQSAAGTVTGAGTPVGAPAGPAPVPGPTTNP
ncbi:MAG: type II secretion system protein [Desulfuromonadales bacterium]|nr:MAG: type II secretion system protein [Desulfuromonadales bacterium]